MSQWETVVVTNPNTGQKTLKEVETGLAPGQTAGTVGGVYVERPEGYSTSKAFIVDTKEQAAQKKKILESKTATHTSAAAYERQVRYMSSIGSPVTPRSEISIKPPGFTPAQLHLLEGMPRASGQAAPRKSMFFKTNLPTRDLGGNSRLKLRPYPSTPIEKETPEGYGYATYPLYKKARDVSEKAQDYTKRSIYKVSYAPKQVKEVATGFSSLFTGLPEFVGSGVVGWEHAAKRTREGKAKQLPGEFGMGLGALASSVATSAKTQPYETAGMGLGLVALGRIGSTGRKVKTPTASPVLRRKGVPSPKPTWKIPENVIDMSVKMPTIKPSLIKPIYKSPLPEKTQSLFTKAQQAALDKGAVGISERGVMGMQFGSKGYRPTGTPKPKNIFYTPPKSPPRKGRVIPGLLVIPGWDVPNTRSLYMGELKRLPKTELKPMRKTVITSTKTQPVVLPGLMGLKVAAKPKTIVETRVKTRVFAIILPKTKVKTSVQLRTKTRTRIKTIPQTKIKTLTFTKVLTKPAIKTSTKIATKTLTLLSVKPKTITKTRILTKPQTRTRILTKPQTQIRVKTQKRQTRITLLKLKTSKKPKRGTYKFKERTGVMLPSQMLFGTRKKTKSSFKFRKWKK